jgi:hypothetical protein
MSIQNKSLGRRTFLRGTGIALALPWMETFAASNQAEGKTPKRFLSVYHPDGVGVPLRADPGWKDWSWYPRGGEKDFEFTKVLDVLEPLRSDVTVYSGLSHPAVRKVHGHSNADQYLTGADTKGHGPYKNSISIDQLYAEHIGEYTRHASLVMSTNGGIGGPRGAQTQSFNREGRPIPAMNKPKQIFDMLFVANSQNAAAKLARSKSALDLLMEDSRTLGRKLSKHDQGTLQQYLDAVRDTEAKLTKAQQWLNTPLPKVDSSHLHLEAGPAEAKQYFQSMYDLIYLAFLSDSTRVATFQLGIVESSWSRRCSWSDPRHQEQRRLEESRNLQPLPGRGIRTFHPKAQGHQRACRRRQYARQHLCHARFCFQ